ncbi:MAG: ABC transporter permease [Akkermansiaceae bacterium]|nr:ABC transporter permease [Akkermansiaceae bacterium]
MPMEKIYPIVLKGETPAAEWETAFRNYANIRRGWVGQESRTGEDRAVPKVQKTGFVRQFVTLMCRQWAIVRADPRNIAFLLAQAVLIGVIVAAVSDQEGFRMFLGVIAAMWFGCSNGAQQVVGELPVFKREHLCGLGMHAYISSKFAFQSWISVVQAVILFGVIVTLANFIHPHELASSFDEELVERYHPGAIYSKSGGGGGAVVADNGETYQRMDPSKLDAVGSTSGYDDIAVGDPGETAASAKRVTLDDVPAYPLIRWLARNFRIEENILQSGRKELKGADGNQLRDPQTGAKLWIPEIPVPFVLVNSLLLKIGSFCLAAVVGVAMGLMISSVVRTTTQAVMWVPLILIPQILLGGYVITIPDMPPYVRNAALAFPSFSCQRLVDVSHVFGRKVPLISNRTKTPTFLTSDKGYGKPVEWEEVIDGKLEKKSERFYESSSVNISWQNLIVHYDRIGQHRQVDSKLSGGKSETVDNRRDVVWVKGTLFENLSPAHSAIMVLLAWIAAAYAVVWASLVKQRGV